MFQLNQRTARLLRTYTKILTLKIAFNSPFSKAKSKGSKLNIDEDQLANHVVPLIVLIQMSLHHHAYPVIFIYA